MEPHGSKDQKLVLDALAWIFNVTTAVGIIMVNKQLMSNFNFNFATTLTGFHFVMTSLMTSTLRLSGYLDPTQLPVMEQIKFALTANISIVGMNVSLMWNNVGFYQIAKLSMIPVSCLLEVFFDKIRYSRSTKLSILLVMIGVGICTVADVTVNAKGMLAAGIAVWSTALQQYYVHFLQKKYKLGSFDLLSHTAPVQAGVLILTGPFVDFFLTGQRVDTYDYSVPSVTWIVLSCLIAVGVNMSQFICIGRFTAVTFQVLGHMKTVAVLTLGFIFFGSRGIDLKVLTGMAFAILGMIWYGNASSRPGGKERIVTPAPVDPEKVPIMAEEGGPDKRDNADES